MYRVAVRAYVLIAVVAMTTPAKADGFGEILAGIAIPASDSDWTKLVGPSPKLAARGGAMQGDFGGMLGLDWTWENLENGGESFVVGSTSASLQRFRLIASGVFRHRLTPKLTLSARAGAGIDVAHASGDFTLFGNHSSTSDTDVGYAFDFGVGIWFDIGSTQLGFELAVPIGHHDKQVEQSGDLPFQWSSLDVDLLVGVRF